VFTAKDFVAAVPAKPRVTSTADARKEFPAVWLSEAEIPATAPWIVKGLIAPGDFIVFYGPPAKGKTAFVGDFAVHVAAGIQQWRQHRISAVPVAYFAPEAGRSILKRFIAARDGLIGESRVEKIPLAILTRGPDLLNLLDVENLIERLRALGVEAGEPIGLVIFDTLSRSIPGGDESRSEDMTALIAVADRLRDEFGTATCFIHHSGKDPAKGARGHSSLFAAADLVVFVDEGVATIEKIRDGVAGEQFPFRLVPIELGTDQDGDPITAVVVSSLGAAPARARRPDKLPGVARIALQALQEAVEEHGERLPETSTIPAGVHGIRLEQWRARFALRYGAGGKDGKRDDEAVSRAFRRGKERLQGDPQRVAVSEPYCWLCT